MRTKHWKQLIWLLVLAASIFLTPRPGGEGVNLLRTYSIEQRVESTQDAYSVFLNNPISGIGFNMYGSYIRQAWEGVPVHPSSPDNSFLLILSTTGLVGFLLFAIFMVWMVKRFWGNWLILESMLVITVHSFTNNSWFYPWVMMWMLMLWGQGEVEGKKQKSIRY